MTLTGKSRLAGIVGWPVGHSRSPRLHGYWLRHYDIDGAYVPLPVPPEKLEMALRGLAVAGFRGVNVTVPHKESALKICDRVEAAAARIGAVNTIVMDDEQLIGSNSDAFGFIENLRQGAPGWHPQAGCAVVLGAGGAARAVIVALLDAGVGELRLLNRTHARAEALATELGQATQGGSRIRVLPWQRVGEALSEAGLLVNTTSLGMAGQPPLQIDMSDLPKTAVVNDIVYTPLETPLLATARSRGNVCVDGLGMLLHQARPGFEAWFGLQPEVSDALRSFVLQD